MTTRKNDHDMIWAIIEYLLSSLAESFSPTSIAFASCTRTDVGDGNDEDQRAKEPHKVADRARVLLAKRVFVDCSVKRLRRGAPADDGNNGGERRADDHAQRGHFFPEQGEHKRKHAGAQRNADKRDDPRDRDPDIVEHHCERAHGDGEDRHAHVRHRNQLFSGRGWVDVRPVDVVGDDGREADQLGAGGRRGGEPDHQHAGSGPGPAQDLVQAVEHRDALADELSRDRVGVRWRGGVVHQRERRQGCARGERERDDEPAQAAEEIPPHAAPRRRGERFLAVAGVGEDGGKAAHHDVPAVEERRFVRPGQVAALVPGRGAGFRCLLEQLVHLVDGADLAAVGVSGEQRDGDDHVDDHRVDPVRQKRRFESSGHGVRPHTEREQHGCCHHVHAGDHADGLAPAEQQHRRDNHVGAHAVKQTHPVGRTAKTRPHNLQHRVCSRGLALYFQCNHRKKSYLDGERKRVPRTGDPVLIGHSRTSEYGASARSRRIRRPRRQGRS
ncbi:hypothetical protein KL942_004694 [Ogataea angusta]|uniref:Uncharacterized protein n=1 Tax=Pichia angusta TaxID=870730 RepID=A0ABQ7RSC5_PICAN|nr:hypothetical protein KL942_004694 [Ogataea angusta]KAG7846468.1 hypothetical protein KL940_004420 [Ogataea angusta]